MPLLSSLQYSLNPDPKHLTPWDLICVCITDACMYVCIYVYMSKSLPDIGIFEVY